MYIASQIDFGESIYIVTHIVLENIHSFIRVNLFIFNCSLSCNFGKSGSL